MTSLSTADFSKSNIAITIMTAVMISAASIYMTTANAAPIYKIVDKKTGQVTFTDRPQSYEQQASKEVSEIAITTGNKTDRSSDSSVINEPPNTQQATAVAVTSTKTAVPVNYQLDIIEPNEERAYRRPAQNINVSVQIKPALQAGDSISIYFDDNEVANGLNASITTVDILPGEHSVQAVVKNKEGQVLQQVSRTIYVIQNTATLQNNKKIAKQLLAYQNLPWHQKVMLKMRQKNIAKP